MQQHSHENKLKESELAVANKAENLKDNGMWKVKYLKTFYEIIEY